MSNAASAYYFYLALKEREKVAVMRKFGYYASADHVEQRAKRYERRAAQEAKRAAPMTGAALDPQFPDDDLHTAS